MDTPLRKRTLAMQKKLRYLIGDTSSHGWFSIVILIFGGGVWANGKLDFIGASIEESEELNLTK